MQRDEVIQAISGHRQELQRLAVKSLWLFGSVARDEAAPGSDVDLLVEFEAGHPTGLFEFIGVQNYLEDILHCRVDLVMREALRQEFREQVQQEAIRAA